MSKVTPRDFRNSFVAVMKAERDNFRTAVGFETKSYNYFLRSNIYPKIAKHLGLVSWTKEYFTLDGMFYEERGTDSTGRLTAYAKRISVAVEHENSAIKAHEKINKLQLFNAPLKVLITYAAEGTETDQLLRRFEKVIAEADTFDDFADLRRQLVILGTPKTVREWQFYAYEYDGFVLMLPTIDQLSLSANATQA